MSKELEVLERWKKNSSKVLERECFAEDYYIIKQALTPPTEEQMCEMLSEEFETKITYHKGYCSFGYLDIEGDFNEIARLIKKTNKIVFDDFLIDYSPHIITELGQFYEGLEDE